VFEIFVPEHIHHIVTEAILSPVNCIGREEMLLGEMKERGANR
jgi:hypothetical protein